MDGGRDRTLASPGERLGAAVLDGVVGIVVLAAAGFAGAVLGILPDALAGLLTGSLSLAAWVVVIASGVMGEGRLGQSYGKHLVGIRVVSTHTGAPIGSGAALGRGVIRGVGAYVFGLGLLWILWDPRRQGWHDKAVSSVVVKASDGGRTDPLTFLRAILHNDPDALTRPGSPATRGPSHGEQ